MENDKQDYEILLTNTLEESAADGEDQLARCCQRKPQEKTKEGERDT